MAIIFKNNSNLISSGTVEIKTREVKSTPVRAVRKNGSITKVYPYQLYINNEEIAMNDDILNMINKIITQINQE